MTQNRLRALTELGQAVWVDNLTRQMLNDGTLERMIADDGLSGVTSNPTTFDKAISDTDDYDDTLRRVAGETDDPTEAFFQLAYRDIRDAADLLRPTWERTEGQDGLVSFELPPDLAYDAQGSIDAAKRFRSEIDRENILIKVPGTREGVQAFEELTAAGVSINVTLLFAVRRYEEIAEAYLRGLERRVRDGEPIDGIVSVASFFVSRVDTKVDNALDELNRPELKGKAAVANAKIAYESFQRLFTGDRWDALRKRGANVQRPLWASTSSKDPDYPETYYVDQLIGPDTVNTMKEKTLDAARENAEVSVSLTQGVQEARDTMTQLLTVGVPVDDIVEQQLPQEGVDAFAESFDSVVESVSRKLTPQHA
ncbi:transaldolase [Phytoactinopolyspora halotolerans]|uniref:Transaldolase n=1 Tax=Phytoactinopolyspora halotolerans TaxID=1981512 RepID=A0A6L9SFW0_9ACTN|nr:transaldolase [Phytoactinopolyspora halotolerans]NEE03331.1 transaldolase [Phytoactinopolyspora halotolerans]